MSGSGLVGWLVGLGIDTREEYSQIGIESIASQARGIERKATSCRAEVSNSGWECERSAPFI